MASLTSTQTLEQASTSVSEIGPPNTQTTPFILPDNCPDGWTWLTGSGVDPAVTGQSSLILYPSDVRTSCMPSAWNRAREFEFAPGVCPQNWTAYDIATRFQQVYVADPDVVMGKPITTGWCCPSGYTLKDGAQISMTSACAKQWDVRSNAAANIEVITRVPDDVDSGPSYGTFKYGEAVQPAWHLTWKDGDLEALTPRPPIVTGASTIRTWIPPNAFFSTPRATMSVAGQDPNWKSTSSDDREDESTLGDIGATIGVPIAIVVGIIFVLASCFTWCCCVRRKRAKEKKRLLADREIENGGVAEGVDAQASILMAERHAQGEDENRRIVGIVAPPKYVKDEVVEPPPAYTPPLKKIED